MACSTAHAPLLSKSTRGISYPRIKNVAALTNVSRQQVVCRRSLDKSSSFAQGKLALATTRARTLVALRAEGDGESQGDAVSKTEAGTESAEPSGEDASVETLEEVEGVEVEQPQRRQRRRGPPRGRRAQAKGPQLDERVVQVSKC